MNNAKEISMMLADRAEQVCMYLLPQGRKQGKRWLAGNVSGKSGKSLVVDLIGSKAGIWADFGEEGSSGDRGDLLELWRRVRGLSFIDAFDEAKSFLGIQVPERISPKQKTFTRPETPKGKLICGDRLDYMINTRKINQATLEKYKVSVNSKNEILFPIVRNGELINIKYLTPRAKPEDKNQWRQESNAEPCLFGWAGVTEDTRSIIITEGEIDALSLNQYPNLTALSIPAGANNLEWLSYEYENLSRFDDIVLMLDMDEAGQKHVHEIAQRLGLERTRIAKLPLKDANEMITSGRLGELNTAIIKANFITPEEIKTPKEYTDVLLDDFNGRTSNKGTTLMWSSTHEKIKFKPAQLSIWQGINGHGKSLLLGYTAIGFIEQGEKVCIFSGEMKPQVTLKRMVTQLAGTKNPTDAAVHQSLDILENGLWLFNFVGNENVDKLLSVFAYAKKRYGITHFIIDSLLKLGLDDDDYNGQKRVVDKLCAFKDLYNVHIHLVVHPKKLENEQQIPKKFDAHGSGSISNLADWFFTVWRNKGKEEKLKFGKQLKAGETLEDIKDKPDAALRCDKCRDSDLDGEGYIPLWFDSDSLQYFDNSLKRKKLWLVEKDRDNYEN